MTTNAAPTLTIREGCMADRLSVVATMAAAFAHGPLAEWLIPNDDLRLGAYREIAHHLFDRVITQRGAYLLHVTDDLTGVAVWSTGQPPTLVDPDAALAWLLDVVGERAAVRYLALEAAIADRLPQGPRLQLEYLGVHPAYHGRGVGSALLEHHHVTADRRGIKATLVATSARSRNLYLRHGYDTDTEFRPGTDGPPLWVMTRQPVAGTG